MADRYYLDYFLEGGQKAVISGSEARHLLRVMRKKKNDPVVLLFNDGYEYYGVIESADRESAVIRIDYRAGSMAEPAFELVLCQGLCRGEKMDWIIQKASELGVSRVVPVHTERSEVKLDKKKAAKKQERWQEIARQAAKQSRRAAAPRIDPVTGLASVTENISDCDLSIFLWERQENRSLRSLLAGSAGAEKICLLVGPEGGLNTAEAGMLENSGFRAASLGARILRTETAAVCGVSCIMYEKGELD